MARLPWTRWICPIDKPIRFDDRGYPEDPAGAYAGVLQPDCRPLESLLDDRCAALLGEAGIGKTDAVDQLEAALRVGSQNVGTPSS